MALEAANRIRGDALGLHLFEQRRGRLALGVKRHGHRHQLLGDLLGGGLRGHLRHRHCQPTRAGEGAEGGVGRRQALGLEAVGDPGGESLAQARQGLGRQFFGEQFDEQGRGGHHAASLVAFSIGKPRASRDSK